MEFSPIECLSARIGILQRKINAIYRTHLSPLHITESQLSILLVVYKNKELGQSEISSILNLERSSLSRNMVRLEKNGWIKKNESYHPIWSLSNSGKGFMKTVLPAWDNAMKEVNSLIGVEGWKSFKNFEKSLN